MKAALLESRRVATALFYLQATTFAGAEARAHRLDAAVGDLVAVLEHQKVRAHLFHQR